MRQSWTATPSRRSVLAGIGLGVLAGCARSGGAASAGNAPATATGSAGNGSAGNGPDPGWAGPSALRDPRARGLPDPLIDTSRLVSGGPGPDGIPSIDAPRFVSSASVADLGASEAVLGVEIDGMARSYPIRVMVWHEIVNDTLAGTPIAVTYCPLCNSALVFDRRAGERILEFGVSGLLYNSDLVMFDRQTESLWPQIEGRAVAGVLTGVELTRYSVTVDPWQAWRAAHPDGEVLSTETGHRRDYGRNPYPGYDNPGDRPFLFDGSLDARLPPKTRVVALRSGPESLVVAFDRIERDRVHAERIGGTPVVLWAAAPVASPLDDDRVSEGTARIGVRVFDPRVNADTLRFVPDGEGYRDEQTGSRWDPDGRARSGTLTGTRLRPIEATQTLWFAWIAFRPDSRVVA